MKTLTWSSSIRLAAASVLFVTMISGPAALRAATESNDAGVRLLRAQLPAGTRISQAGCEALSRAVSRATTAHRTDAPAILSAALTGGVGKDQLRREDKLSCECVSSLTRASLKAAPAQSSAIIDMAVALYPDCADALAAVVKNMLPVAVDEPVAGINNVVTPGGFNQAGVGPGAPGSPGFSGSAPSGGFALPPVTAPAVTSAVNQ